MTTKNTPSSATVNVKLILYVIIAMLTTMISEFDAVAIDEMANMHWMHWITKFAAVCLPGLVAWRAFLDQSITERNTARVKDAADQPPLPPQSAAKSSKD